MGKLERRNSFMWLKASSYQLAPWGSVCLICLAYVGALFDLFEAVDLVVCLICLMGLLDAYVGWSV